MNTNAQTGHSHVAGKGSMHMAHILDDRTERQQICKREAPIVAPIGNDKAKRIIANYAAMKKALAERDSQTK